MYVIVHAKGSLSNNEVEAIDQMPSCKQHLEYTIIIPTLIVNLLFAFKMFKVASRLLRGRPIPSVRHARLQCQFSTAPPSQQSRSWKNYATRWGLAIGAVYYYNTSNVFAEEPACPSPSCQRAFFVLTTCNSSSPSYLPQRGDLHSNPRINSCSPPVENDSPFPNFPFSYPSWS